MCVCVCPGRLGGGVHVDEVCVQIYGGGVQVDEVCVQLVEVSV